VYGSAPGGWAPPRSPGFPHLRHLLLALAAAVVLVHVVLILFVFRGPGFSAVNDLLFPLESAGAAAAFLAAALNRRSDGVRPFVGWMLVALGFCCMAAGDLAWLILEVLARARPFPSAGDVVYMLAYPLIFAGVLCQSRGHHPPGERVSRLLDAAVTVSSAGLLLWITVLGPVVKGALASGSLENAIIVLYPLVDLVLLSVLIVLAFERRWGLSPAVRALLLAGTLGQIAGDSSFGLTVVFGSYVSGSPGDIGYVVSYACAACAGILVWRGGRATPELQPDVPGQGGQDERRGHPGQPGQDERRGHPGQREPHGLPWQDYLPFLGGFAVVFTLLWGRTHPIALGPAATGAWTIAIVALSSARQILTAQAAARRTRELRESRDQLELRVAERTETLAAANRDLSRVVKIRNALAAELDLPVMMRTIVEEISAVVGWPCVTLYLPEPDCLSASCHVGQPAARDRVEANGGAVYRSAAGGAAIRVADCAADPDFPGAHGRHLSAIVAPLLQDEQVIGVLVAEREEPDALTDSDLGLLQTIAFHASRALRSSRLFAQLRESEHRARALLDSSPDAVVITGADLRVVMANRQAAALLGVSDPDRLVGVPAMNLVHPADHERVMQRIAALAQGGGHVSSEFLAVRPDGLTLPVETRGSLVPSPDGSPPEIIVVARDITARRIAEEELKSSHEKLERSVEERTAALREIQERLRQAEKMEAVGRLAGGIAHDFNNLLTVIIGNSQSLVEEGLGGPREREELRAVLEAAERAAALTRQLLTFSRQQPRRVQVVDLGAVVAGIQDMVRRLVGEHVRVTVSQANGPQTVLADPVQVEQVILNLASNSADAMPAGGVLTIRTEKVRLGAQTSLQPDVVPPGSYVRLTVSDTGTGIPVQVQARVFEPFFTTKEAGKGTGMGLSTVLGIVKQSQGYVGLRSAPQRGTTVQVWLPAADDSEADSVVTAPAAPAVSAAPAEAAAPAAPAAVAIPFPTPPVAPGDLPAAGGETILVVDDQEDVRKVTVSMLQKLGYTALSASSAAEALSVLSYEGNRRVDLVLTDISMPDMTGHALASGLAGASTAPRILFMSGYAGEIPGSHATGHGFIQKPFTRAALARAVRAALDQGR